MKAYIKGRFKSIGHSLRGLKSLLRTEPNAAIHLLATLAVGAAGVLFQLPAPSWVLLVIAVALVWIAEAFNTAIEKLCDLYTRSQHPQVRFIKDVSAAAVLLAAILAAIIGLYVFIPVIFAT